MRAFSPARPATLAAATQRRALASLAQLAEHPAAQPVGLRGSLYCRLSTAAQAVARATVAANLRHLRQRHGLTQGEMAARFGASRPAYAAWEEQRAAPSLSAVRQGCRRLDVTIDAFLTTRIGARRVSP